MLIVVLFIIFIVSFWLENVLGVKLSGTTGLSLKNIAFYMLFIAWAVKATIRRRIVNKSKISKYLLFLLCVVILSIPVKHLLGEIPGISLYKDLIHLKGWLDPVLLYLILFNTVEDENSSKYVLMALLAFYAASVITSLAVSTGVLTIGKVDIFQERTAGFAEPNQFAAFLVLFLPLLFSGSIAGSRMIKCASYVGIFLSFIALVVTGSRGGFISLFFAGCVYFLLMVRHRIISLSKCIVIFFVCIPVISATAYIFAPANVKHAVVERFNPSNSSDVYEYTSGRTVLWRNGFLLFLDSPIYGHGINTFIPLMKKRFVIWGNSHNDYLLYLVQYGVVGFGIFIMVLLSVFFESLRIVKTTASYNNKIIAMSYLAGFAGFCLAMFSVNIIQPLYLFWAYTAVVLGFKNIEENAGELKSA